MRQKEQKEQRLKDLGLPGPETLATAPRVLDVTGLGGGGSSGGGSRIEVESLLLNPVPLGKLHKSLCLSFFLCRMGIVMVPAV